VEALEKRCLLTAAAEIIGEVGDFDRVPGEPLYEEHSRVGDQPQAGAADAKDVEPGDAGEPGYLETANLETGAVEVGDVEVGDVEAENSQSENSRPQTGLRTFTIQFDAFAPLTVAEPEEEAEVEDNDEGGLMPEGEGPSEVPSTGPPPSGPAYGPALPAEGEFPAADSPVPDSVSEPTAKPPAASPAPSPASPSPGTLLGPAVPSSNLTPTSPSSGKPESVSEGLNAGAGWTSPPASGIDTGNDSRIEFRIDAALARTAQAAQAMSASSRSKLMLSERESKLLDQEWNQHGWNPQSLEEFDGDPSQRESLLSSGRSQADKSSRESWEDLIDLLFADIDTSQRAADPLAVSTLKMELVQDSIANDKRTSQSEHLRAAGRPWGPTMELLMRTAGGMLAIKPERTPTPAPDRSRAVADAYDDHATVWAARIELYRASGTWADTVAGPPVGLPASGVSHQESTDLNEEARSSWDDARGATIHSTLMHLRPLLAASSLAIGAMFLGFRRQKRLNQQLHASFEKLQ
jgi:hypothetical protein